jgi:molybdopterin-guanine dinucleotide biosynthesis protein A
MPILERQVSVLREITGSIVLVTAGDDQRDEVPGLRVVLDLIPGAGPLGGIYTAVRTASPGRALVVACDMPFLTAAFLRRLVAENTGIDAVVPRTADGYHPLCALYAPSAAARIHQRIQGGLLKVIDALADLRVHEIGPEEIAPYDPDGTLFVNINTPDDYQRALRLPGRR